MCMCVRVRRVEIDSQWIDRHEVVSYEHGKCKEVVTGWLVGKYRYWLMCECCSSLPYL